MLDYGVDYINIFCCLVDVVIGDDRLFLDLFGKFEIIGVWFEIWKDRFEKDLCFLEDICVQMNQVNLFYILRNYLVEVVFFVVDNEDYGLIWDFIEVFK